MKTKMKKRAWAERGRYYVTYSLLFGIMVLLVFWYFWKNNRSFIWYPDGWTQHLRALTYYSQWLRTLLSNFFNGQGFEVPTYTFGLGYGGDVLTTLNFYVIGDPLTLVSVFVSAENMAKCYAFLYLLRLYLAGVSFSCYCFFMGQKNNKAVLAGSFVYVFCGYALLYGIRHSFFLNPMIYLPLLFVGVERILREKRAGLFVGMVCLSAISNFYFFYTIVLFTVLYVACRLLPGIKEQGVKKQFCRVLPIAGASCVGVALSAVILIPVLMAFFSDKRLGVENKVPLTYTLKYYGEFAKSFITCQELDNDGILGYSAVVLLLVVLLLFNQQRKMLRNLFVGGTILLMLPVAGYAFNGFSYVSGRFVWGYGFLIAQIVVCEWEEFLELNLRKIALMISGLASYVIICMLFRIPFGKDMKGSIGIALLLVGICFLEHKRKFLERNWREGILLAAICGSIVFNANQLYSPFNGGGGVCASLFVK